MTELIEALEYVVNGGGDTYGSDEWRDICRDALAEIQRLSREQFRADFRAALTGLLVANPYHTQGSYAGDDRLKIVMEAEAIARTVELQRRSRGEDS